jgi:hypothetical protein
VQGDGVEVKQVAGEDRVRLSLQKLPPGRACATRWTVPDLVDTRS